MMNEIEKFDLLDEIENQIVSTLKDLQKTDDETDVDFLFQLLTAWKDLIQIRGMLIPIPILKE